MFLPILVALFLAAWGLVSSSYAEHSPKSKKTRIIATPAPRNRTETQSAANQQQNQSPTPSPTPSPISSVNAPAAQKETRQADEQPSQIWVQDGSKEVDLSGWALVIVGAAGVGCALWTLKALREQIADGKTVAQAAKKSADVAESALRLTERPDILVDDMSSSTPHRFTPTTFITSTVKNFGRTRALDVVIAGWITHTEIDFDNPPPVNRAAPITISPTKATLARTGQTFDFSPQEIAQIETRQRPVFYAIEITYRDGFGESHYTRIGGTFDLAGNNFPQTRHEAT